jgi:hypothetical protein
MRESLHIVTNQVLRDERTERRIQEINRERAFYFMILIGAVLTLYAVL